MQFQTDRLIIRFPEITDAADIYNNYASDPDVTRYMTWRPHPDLAATREWLEENIESMDENKHLSFVLCHRGNGKENGKVIGSLGFSVHGSCVHFGYVLAKPYWNKGLMTEACIPVIRYLLDRDDVHRIEAVHDLDNPASGRVMEKIGMKFEEIVRKHCLHPNISDTPCDCKRYALTK